ncbi:MAG: hypothetical protein ABSA16_11735 [Thermoguttaceae bacterium]|jgi:hypothetical protein
MKHIEITQQPEAVRNFVLSLGTPPEDLILDVNGVPFARMAPIAPDNVDKNLLAQAILARRDESSKNNADWEHLGLECWEKSL